MKSFIISFYIIIILAFFFFSCATMSSSFKKAKQKDTFKSYERFLKKCPHSEFADSAKARMEELRYQQYADVKDNIFACKYWFNGWDGKTHTTCYDDRGNKLFDETYDVLTELGFSKEKINKIKENYKSGCITKFKYSEIPSSVITQCILKSELFTSKGICVNVDYSIHSWSYNNHKYYYFKSSAMGGGNFRGTYWILNVEPYTTDGINSDRYPFLSCENFSASKYQSWSISVKKDEDILKIVVGNVKPSARNRDVRYKDLDEEGLFRLSMDFTTCNAKYYYNIEF